MLDSTENGAHIECTECHVLVAMSPAQRSRLRAAKRGRIRCPTCKATIQLDARHPALAQAASGSGAERPAPPQPAGYAPASPCARPREDSNDCREGDAPPESQERAAVDLTTPPAERPAEHCGPPHASGTPASTPPTAQRTLPPSLRDPGALRAAMLAHAFSDGESPRQSSPQTPPPPSPPTHTATPPAPAATDADLAATTPLSSACAPHNPPEAADDGGGGEEEPPQDTWATYRPHHVRGGKPHPDPVVESAALAAVPPPAATHAPRIRHAIEQGLISALQLESIVYAMQRHEQSVWLADAGGQTRRYKAGFFIGDGAGVGKGRTLAAMILEAWCCGRRRHVWVSVSSDLCADAKRDLRDVGAGFIPVHVLQSVPYAKTASIQQDYPEGVMFLSYTTLTTGSKAKGLAVSRAQQLLRWCGTEFDGLLLFDECHKAKNHREARDAAAGSAEPEATAGEGGGGRKKRKPADGSMTGLKVAEVQALLPRAAVVYCSATGAAEVANMSYMTRLGLWGPGTPFTDFKHFKGATKRRGITMMQLVAMHLKSQGAYVCRMLSFEGASFTLERAELSEAAAATYAACCALWRDILKAVERAFALQGLPKGRPEDDPQSYLILRQMWGTHQNFFRGLCLAAKVERIAELAQARLAGGFSVVLGLQATGEAAASTALKASSTLHDFVSSPKELLRNFLASSFPAPPAAAARSEEDAMLAAAPRKRRRGAACGGLAVAPGVPAIAAGPLAGPGDGEAVPVDVVRAAAGSTLEAAAAVLDGGDGVDPAQSSDSDSVVSDPEGDAEGAGAPGMSAPSPKKRERKGSGLRRDGHLTEAAYAEIQATKRALLHRVDALQLPTNPLEAIISRLGGPGAVAEMTGRKARLERQADGRVRAVERCKGRGAAAAETLASVNIAEKQAFLNGTKRVAIISDAASTGISLHAERRQMNRQRRAHITVELPWSAEKAVQQFGRTHRANQVHAPAYAMVFTPLGGEQRVAAAVARRLLTMGALTHGETRAHSAAFASEQHQYDSRWGEIAQERLFATLLAAEAGQPGPSAQNLQVAAEVLAADGSIAALAFKGTTAFLRTAAAALRDAGGLVKTSTKAPVMRFLNRLFGVPPALQVLIFELFQRFVDAAIVRLRQTGEIDQGLTEVRGTSIVAVAAPEVLVPGTARSAPTRLHHLRCDRSVPHAAAAAALAAVRGDAADARAAGAPVDTAHTHVGFWARGTARHPHGAVLVLGWARRTRAEAEGGEEARLRTVRPRCGYESAAVEAGTLRTEYQRLSDAAAEALWAREAAGTEDRIEDVHVLTGTILPHWGLMERCLQEAKHDGERKVKAVRVQPTAASAHRGAAAGDGEAPDALLGIRVPEGAVERVRAAVAEAGRSGEVLRAAAVKRRGGGAGRGPGKRGAQGKKGGKEIPKLEVTDPPQQEGKQAAKLVPGGYWAQQGAVKQEPEVSR